MNKSRLEAFTDAVIAILMTILVLNLAAPADDSLIALWNMRYSFLVYLVSFFSLAIYWNNHHHLLQITKRISGGVLWYNMLFLLCLSLFPFATSWVDKNTHDLVPEFTYGLVVLSSNVSYALLARAIVRVNGPHSEVAKALQGSRKSGYTICINVIGLVLGIVFPMAIIVSYAASMLLWIIPEKRIEQFFRELDFE